MTQRSPSGHSCVKLSIATPSARVNVSLRSPLLFFLTYRCTFIALRCRDDVAVNPNDTEESIWAFLCEAQLEGPEAARQNMLKVGQPTARSSTNSKYF
jgi:hypothetical protein